MKRRRSLKNRSSSSLRSPKNKNPTRKSKSSQSPLSPSARRRRSASNNVKESEDKDGISYSELLLELLPQVSDDLVGLLDPLPALGEHLRVESGMGDAWEFVVGTLPEEVS